MSVCMGCPNCTTEAYRDIEWEDEDGGITKQTTLVYVFKEER